MKLIDLIVSLQEEIKDLECQEITETTRAAWEELMDELREYKYKMDIYNKIKTNKI